MNRCISKFAVSILVLALCLLLSGCPTDLDQQGYSLQRTVDTFCQAADSRDTETIVNLFSPNVRAEVGDDALIAAVQELFAFYPGPTDECALTRTPGGSGHIGSGKNSFTTSAWIPVVCEGINYYCSITLTTQDQNEPDNLGVQRIVFVSEQVRCSEWNDEMELPKGNGLFVVTKVPEDFQTIRVGDLPYIYTPVNRVITQEDIWSFCQEDNSWNSFHTRFGEPNAVEYLIGRVSSYIYELPPEDGEPRYASVGIDSDGLIYGVYLYDGTHYSDIGTIWKPEE